MRNKLNNIDSLKNNKKNMMVTATIFFAIVGTILIIRKVFNFLRKKSAIRVDDNKAPVYNLKINSKGDVTVNFPEDDYYEEDYEEDYEHGHDCSCGHNHDHEHIHNHEDKHNHERRRKYEHEDDREDKHNHGRRRKYEHEDEDENDLEHGEKK